MAVYHQVLSYPRFGKNDATFKRLSRYCAGAMGNTSGNKLPHLTLLNSNCTSNPEHRSWNGYAQGEEAEYISALSSAHYASTARHHG